MHSNFEKESSDWFTNLFKSATISVNLSSTGPITVCTTPSNIFERSVIENLGIRAILSSGIGEHDYQDRMFSARITLPKLKYDLYEALIFNFIVIEDNEQLTLKMNSKALTLLILIYPKRFRKYVNRLEMDLELMLSQTSVLPKNISELLDKKSLLRTVNTLQKTIITLENESLLNYEEFTIEKMFDSEKMKVKSEFYIDDLL